MKKGAQKLLKFGHDVLKTHNDNPEISLLDATKKTAKNKITSGINDFLQQKTIKPQSNQNTISTSLKRKATTSKSKKKSNKKAKLIKNKFTL